MGVICFSQPSYCFAKYVALLTVLSFLQMLKMFKMFGGVCRVLCMITYSKKLINGQKVRSCPMAAAAAAATKVLSHGKK